MEWLVRWVGICLTGSALEVYLSEGKSGDSRFGVLALNICHGIGVEGNGMAERKNFKVFWQKIVSASVQKYSFRFCATLSYLVEHSKAPAWLM